MMNGSKWAGALVVFALCVGAVGASAQPMPTAERLIKAVYLPSDTTGGRSVVIASKSVNMPGHVGGMLEVYATLADSVAADSVALEVFAWASIRDSVPDALWDSDDSNDRIDGWFLTSITDTAQLQVPTNLTPLSDNSVKWPWKVSSRQQWSQLDHSGAGSAIVSAGKGATPNVQKWIIQIGDGFGGRVTPRKILFAVQNRHPRTHIVALDVWFAPGTK